LAEGVGATMRRMQRERESRVLLYESSGIARLVAPGTRGHDEILDVAQRMVELEAAELEQVEEDE